jgi:hypothetical protein
MSIFFFDHQYLIIKSIGRCLKMINILQILLHICNQKHQEHQSKCRCILNKEKLAKKRSKIKVPLSFKRTIFKGKGVQWMILPLGK